jgi:hypothetical protein
MKLSEWKGNELFKNICSENGVDILSVLMKHKVVTAFVH